MQRQTEGALFITRRCLVYGGWKLDGNWVEAGCRPGWKLDGRWVDSGWKLDGSLDAGLTGKKCKKLVLFLISLEPPFGVQQ